MDMNTVLQGIVIADGVFALYFMLWVMLSNGGTNIMRKRKGEPAISGEVGKDIFNCPYGHHFLRDEAVIFVDNVRGEYRIYCPKCWEKGKRVLVARERVETPVIIEAPKEPNAETKEAPKEDADADVMKVFDDLNVRLRKIEEAMENITRRLEALEKERAHEAIPVIDEETGEVVDEIAEEPKKRRRRKK